ncbi:hypothetical protein WG899_15470 [Paucibacter sp. AS339]|uniref:hypothetical protein n=1 Tax=Paucibacter hankyongi TaxID=3133434 RepID=UPI0030A4AB0F
MRTSLAVGLAQLFAADHREINEAQINIMREHFSEPELVELIAFMGFMWAGGTFGKIFDIQPTQGSEALAPNIYPFHRVASTITGSLKHAHRQNN